MQPVLVQFETAPEVCCAPANSVRSLNHKVIVFAIVLATMVAYFAPLLIMGGKSYFTIHDNLDDEFVTNYLLVKTHTALVFDGSTPIESIMNGLPRATLPSGLNVGVLLFYLFPPLWAYIVNFILVHTIAFFGMFLLLRKHFLPDEDDYHLAAAVSICFFLVPYYTVFGLTVAGQPLLAYAFLNVRDGQATIKDYLIILLFPLWSAMVLTAPFAGTALVVILVVDWIRSGRFNRRFLVSIGLLLSVYAALQYQMAFSILRPGSWVSHRIAWNMWTDLNLSSDVHKTFGILTKTQFHSGTFWTFPAIIALAASLGLLITGRRRAGRLEFLAIATLLVGLEYGFWAWLYHWFGWMIKGSQAFNGSRFFFLLPLLWMLIFALSLKDVKRIKWGTAIVWCLVAVQIAAILKFNIDYRHTVRAMISGPSHIYEPSFDRFYAQDLFTQIDKFIGRPKSSYRVVSLGMYASIAQFNGFYTLDAYLNNYSLAYKLQFRQIIHRELDKSPELQQFFDGWGSRCYIFSSEIGTNSWAPRQAHVVVHHLELDTNQLRAMGGEYLISAARIENSDNIGLHFEKEFVSPNSFWDIYLYHVVPTNPSQTADSNLQ